MDINIYSIGSVASISALEIRLSAASPPPSFAEAMGEFGRGESFKFIKVLRRNDQGDFDTVYERNFAEEAHLPKEWPALQWGDILEVQTKRSQHSTRPLIEHLATLIPDRTITVSLGEFSCQQKIPGNSRYWTEGGKGGEEEFSGLGKLLDFSQFSVHRKGVDQPIQVDFTQPGAATRFRFIDGDVVEMAFDALAASQELESSRQIGLLDTSNRGYFQKFSEDFSAMEIFSNDPIPGNLDFSNVAILRIAGAKKTDSLNVEAWLDALPVREKWTKEALSTIEPKFKAGDLIVLFPATSESAEVTAKLTHARLADVRQFMNPSRPQSVTVSLRPSR